MRTYTHSIDTPLGKMCLRGTDSAVTGLGFGEAPREEPSPLLLEAERQLGEYFSGVRREFDLPLEPAGTEFQQTVWRELRRIPYGETVSYGQLAARIGKPRACRAVGGANNRNPIAIILPCHRVVGSGGDLTGYAGGLDKKRYLLKLEGVEL